jgi:CheY-like chemotaxis protein
VDFGTLGPPVTPATRIENGNSAQVRPARPLRVVVVDDNQDMVAVTVELLRDMGHDARGCYGGREAIDCVEECDPDVVLMDLAMPGVSGWNAAQIIRHKYPKRPMLIAITGEYTRGADKLLSEMSGFDYFLVKPVDPKVLEALIEKVGSQSTSRSRLV